MPEANLVLGDAVLMSWEGDFASPLPLVLFERSEFSEGRFVTSSEQALTRLEALGADIDGLHAFCWALHRVASLREAAWLRNPAIAWAGLAPHALLRHSSERGAVGFEEHFEHIDTGTLAKDLDLEVNRAEMALAVLSYRAMLDLDAAELVYDVSELVGDIKPEKFADSLWRGRPSSESLEQPILAVLSGAVRRFLDDRVPLRIWTEDAGFPAAWPVAAGEEPEWSDDFAGAATADKQDEDDVSWVLDVLPDKGPRLLAAPNVDDATRLLEKMATERLEHPVGHILAAALAGSPAVPVNDVRTFSRLALAYAERVKAEQPEEVEAVVLPLLWRDPEDLVRRLPRLMEGRFTAELVEAIGAALALSRGRDDDPDEWRAAGVRLGSNLIDAGDPIPGLQLLRSAADVNGPPQTLVKALRTRLATVYGLELLTTGSVDDAPFLLDSGRPSRNHRRDLSRLLYDAIVGSVYEPLVGDAEAQDAFFEAHISPGMAYLESDPRPGGGRRRIGPDRDDTSGPGLGMALMFLLGLAMLIVGIGLAMVYLL